VTKALGEALRTRRAEIEQLVLARVYGIVDPPEAGHGEYAAGLKVAVSAAIEYGLEVIEARSTANTPPPAALLVQARLAARNGVSLDTVLRRYCAGNSFLVATLFEEAGTAGLSQAELQRVFRLQAGAFDRLLEAVGEEYKREVRNRPETSEQRRADLVRRLLDGELIDAAEIGYGFDDHHLAAAAVGSGREEAIRALALSLDCRLLLVHADEQTCWAWFGSSQPADSGDAQAAASGLRPQVALAIGEPAVGLSGWCLSHRQATAALPVARRRLGSAVRYCEVALLASALQDDLLATSLRRLYLEPLEAYRDGGQVARQTLRAYLLADRNVSSAAAALGVRRHTVANRLRTIEGQIGRPLSDCTSEIEAALHLEDLGPPVKPGRFEHPHPSLLAGHD
jgi:DNA-binding PucR family transcriptional regulator